MFKKLALITFAILFLGCLLPAEGVIPVKNATEKDWNQHSYWFHPWGKSGVHKGIDIFANKGRPVLASTSGIVIFKGNIKLGGNVIAVLGPKWRIHYFAHLQNQHVGYMDWVSQGEEIGTVGDTGNAAGKPPHLHYSILSLIPSINEITLEPQGWKRMFYRNPTHTW